MGAKHQAEGLGHGQTVPCHAMPCHAIGALPWRTAVLCRHVAFAQPGQFGWPAQEGKTAREQDKRQRQTDVWARLKHGNRAS